MSITTLCLRFSRENHMFYESFLEGLGNFTSLLGSLKPFLGFFINFLGWLFKFLVDMLWNFHEMLMEIFISMLFHYLTQKIAAWILEK